MLALPMIRSSDRLHRLGLVLVALVVGGFLCIVPHFPLLAIGLIVVALLEKPPHRITCVLLILASLTIPTIPWLHRYQPAVVAAPDCDCEMRWLTQPDNWLVRRKYSQIFWRRRPCDYDVLGWSAENVLYYEEACRDRDSKVWAYNPERDNNPRQVETVPVDLIRETIRQRAISEQIRPPSVRLFNVEPPGNSRLESLVTVTGNLEYRSKFCLLWPIPCDLIRAFVPNPHLEYCCGESVERAGPGPRIRLRVVSSDGRRVAVIARYPYGPEDVVVLSASDSEGAR